MGRLYNRSFKLKIGPITINADSLKVTFNIFKSSQKKVHDTAEVKVWNLNETSRAALKGDIRVALIAGYEDDNAVIFNGMLQEANTTHDSADIITSFTLEDGAEMRPIRKSFSFPKGMGVKEAAQAVIKSTGLDVKKALKDLDSGDASLLYKLLLEKQAGFSASGKIEEVLKTITDKIGADYQINGGELMISPKGRPTLDPPVFLDAMGGLIGTPSIGAKGIIKIKCLMRSSLLPKNTITVQSSSVNGTFMIQSVRFSGDSHGQDWYNEIEAVEF